MLDYSTEALNVKSFFYNKDFIVYVEGQDDINYWDSFISNYSDSDYIVEESPGGKNGLVLYMDKIVEEDAKIIVACDSDYDTILPPDRRYLHDRIVRTYGYSIENSMYCPHNINQMIRRYGKIRKDFLQEITEWYEQFLENSRILLIYDLANNIFSKGIQILGDKCVQFLTSPQSINISKTKVDRYISSISEQFEEDQLNTAKELISNSPKELRYLFKGHFLTNAVLNFIRYSIKKETSKNSTISLDSLYALMVSCVGVCNNECLNNQQTTERIRLSIESLQ